MASANNDELDTMASANNELMVARLKEMQAATPDIEASAVVSVDGLIVGRHAQPGRPHFA